LFEDAIEKAIEMELYTKDEAEKLEAGIYQRGDAVKLMVKALLTTMNGSDDTLLSVLAYDGVFSFEAASELVKAVEDIYGARLDAGEIDGENETVEEE
jgi:hypothetical protein